MNHVRKSNAGRGLDGNLVNDDFDYAVISGFLSVSLYDVTRKFTRGISERGSFPGGILGAISNESAEQLLTRQERIDYILVSPELEPKCVDAKVCNGRDNLFLSDHYPVHEKFVGVGK